MKPVSWKLPLDMNDLADLEMAGDASAFVIFEGERLSSTGERLFLEGVFLAFDEPMMNYV